MERLCLVVVMTDDSVWKVLHSGSYLVCIGDVLDSIFVGLTSLRYAAYLRLEEVKNNRHFLFIFLFLPLIVIEYLVAVVLSWSEKRYHRRCCYCETFGKANGLVNQIV